MYGSVRGAISNGRPYRDSDLDARLREEQAFTLATEDSPAYLPRSI